METHAMKRSAIRTMNVRANNITMAMIKPRSSDELNSEESSNEKRWTQMMWCDRKNHNAASLEKTLLRQTSIPFRICGDAFQTCFFSTIRILPLSNWTTYKRICEERETERKREREREREREKQEESNGLTEESKGLRTLPGPNHLGCLDDLQAPSLCCDVSSSANRQNCCWDWLRLLASLPFISRSFLWCTYLPVLRTTLSLELVLPPVWNTREKKKRSQNVHSEVANWVYHVLKVQSGKWHCDKSIGQSHCLTQVCHSSRELEAPWEESLMHLQLLPPCVYGYRKYFLCMAFLETKMIFVWHRGESEDRIYCGSAKPARPLRC